MFAQRVERFRSALHIDATQLYLLSAPHDVVYFCGFEYLVPTEREAFFIIGAQEAFLIKASFSSPPTTPQPPFYQILDRCAPQSLAEHLGQIIAKNASSSISKINQIFIDSSSLFLEERDTLHAKLPDVKLQHFDRQKIWELRMTKDTDEQAHMRQAAQIIAQSMEFIRSQLSAGMTELDVKWMLEEKMRTLGSGGPAFPIIVAFGANGAYPHYQPQNVALKENTAVLIDAGATAHGYCSDMTRSWWFGASPDAEFERIGALVRQANGAAFGHLKNSIQKGAKISAQDLDKSARAVIVDAGYGEEFFHTTGHGIGLNIHEPPSLSWSNAQELRAGMCVTIEPGVYLPGKFGYRHENTILIQEDSAIELTTDVTP
jgi:Xaa-Pro aminopeptidase